MPDDRLLHFGESRGAAVVSPTPIGTTTIPGLRARVQREPTCGGCADRASCGIGAGVRRRSLRVGLRAQAGLDIGQRLSVLKQGASMLRQLVLFTVVVSRTGATRVGA